MNREDQKMDLIIGIDPDLEKSGVAIKDKNGLRLMNLTFVDLKNLFEQNMPFIKKVVIEAGWQNKKSNFRNIQSRLVAERTAKNVGENNATGKLIAQLVESMGIPVVLIKPTRSKLSADQFNKVVGWDGRSNQEQRDAAMLILNMK
ncbi:hypothetical protein [Acinetobacter puyangensis]|uniref:hypothetical protein n=1 Tax=Acinetobacter puyangensis TaxID=1096779 RepID=UPI003A4E652D